MQPSINFFKNIPNKIKTGASTCKTNTIKALHCVSFNVFKPMPQWPTDIEVQRLYFERANIRNRRSMAQIAYVALILTAVTMLLGIIYFIIPTVAKLLP